MRDTAGCVPGRGTTGASGTGIAWGVAWFGAAYAITDWVRAVQARR